MGNDLFSANNRNEVIYGGDLCNLDHHRIFSRKASAYCVSRLENLEIHPIHHPVL